MVTIILLQLFWASFGFIGLAELFLVAQRLKRTRQCAFLQYIRTTHPALQAVLLFVLGLMPLVPVVVVSYILQWSLWVLTAYYVALIVGAFIVSVRYHATIIRHVHWPTISRTTFMLGIIAAASLLFDFIVSMRVGAPLYGDAPVQLAKITYFRDVHFTLADPYYSNHGIVDPRYSTNLLDACQALATRLFHVTTVKVWSYSYAFYRLLIWLSLFGLLWTYLGKKYRYLAYVVLAVMPFVWGGYFIFADLPDRIVLAWAMLFLVGLKLWLESDSWQLMVVAALLTATTHALFSLILLGYVAFLMAVLWLSRTTSLKRMLAPSVCAFLLALPVGLNLYYPNRTNQDTLAFISGAIAGTPPQLHHYGPFTLSMLPTVPIFTLVVYGLFVVYVWLVRRTGRQKLLLPTYATACVAVVFAFNANLFALVGYGVIIYLVKRRSVRIAVGALVAYYGVIVYNPVFWHFGATKLPLWVVARFQELNVFGMVATILSLLFTAMYPLERWGYRRLKYAMLAIVAALVIWYFPQPTTNDYNIHNIWDAKNISFNAQRIDSLNAIASLRSDLRGQVVYSNDMNVTTRIPGIVPANVYSFNPQNESPMTNIALRERCSNQLATSMQLHELLAAGITRVITDPPYSQSMARLAKTRPYLSLIAQVDGYQVYAVEAGKVATTLHDHCAVPFGQ